MKATKKELDSLHWTTNFKYFFVYAMNMVLICLFASMKLENEVRFYYEV